MSEAAAVTSEVGFELELDEQLALDARQFAGTDVAENDDRRPWDRQPNETDAQYRAFLLFRQQRSWTDVLPRSMADVVASMNPANSEATFDVVRRVAHRFRWRLRCRAWDDHERQKWESAREAEMVKLSEDELRVARMAVAVSAAALSAAGKSFAAYGPQGAHTMAPDDAAKSATVVGQLMQRVVRPVLPDEHRGADLKISGGVATEHVITIDNAAADAFIAAASRIADEQRPRIPGILDRLSGELTDEAIETTATETTNETATETETEDET